MADLSKVKIRRPYDVHKRFPKVIEGVSRTKGSFKDECDINQILLQFDRTGIITHRSRFNGEYGNFITSDDYHSSLNKVLEAKEMFMSLPSKIRSRFDNDPSQFLDFTQDPGNEDEMVEMGLLKREPVSVSEGGVAAPGAVSHPGPETDPGDGTLPLGDA